MEQPLKQTVLPFWIMFISCTVAFTISWLVYFQQGSTLSVLNICVQTVGLTASIIALFKRKWKNTTANGALEPNPKNGKLGTELGDGRNVS